MSLLSPSLEAFWAVVEKGTVLEAAKIVNLTQTGVTQRIRSLEKQLGVTLFTRSRKGMRLTNEGESLLRYVQAARDLEGDTLSDLGGKKKSVITNICISGNPAVIRARVIPRIGTLLKKHPQIRIRFDLTEADNSVEKLKNGFAQLVVVPTSFIGKEVVSKSLPAEKYILIGPSTWKKRTLADILEKESAIDLDSQASITDEILKKYKLTKKARSEKHYANDIDALTSLIQHGVGYSALPYELAAGLLKNGSLIQIGKDMVLEKAVSVAWYPRSSMPQYLKDLIDIVSKK